jgi:hypothetical protein
MEVYNLPCSLANPPPTFPLHHLPSAAPHPLPVSHLILTGSHIFIFSSFRDQRPSDDTLAAVLSILHEVVKKNAPFAVSLYEVNSVSRSTMRPSVLILRQKLDNIDTIDMGGCPLHIVGFWGVRQFSSGGLIWGTV